MLTRVSISGARASISEEGSSGLAEDINLLDAGSAARRLPPGRSLTCSTCADWPVCEATVQSRRQPSAVRRNLDPSDTERKSVCGNSHSGMGGPSRWGRCGVPRLQRARAPGGTVAPGRAQPAAVGRWGSCENMRTVRATSLAPCANYRSVQTTKRSLRGHSQLGALRRSAAAERH